MTIFEIKTILRQEKEHKSYAQSDYQLYVIYFHDTFMCIRFTE